VEETGTYHEYIIIGAGIAGIKAAETIRACDADACIQVISDEPGFPYKRTDIDKHIANGFTNEDFLLHPAEWFKDSRIELLSEAVVEQIIPDKKLIILQHSGKHRYGKLLIASGAAPVVPEIIKSQNIPAYYIRTKSETLNFLEALKKSKSVTIIGGGVQSVEIAEQCILAGKKVTLLSRSSNLLQKYFPEDYSIDIERMLSEKGADLNLSIGISDISYRKGEGYDLKTTGKIIHSDLLVCTCGIIPNTVVVNNTGIQIGKGIMVNSSCETNMRDIFAAGDCAQYETNPPAGLWHSAEFMGKVAGQNMTGNTASLSSKTFRLKCELFGRFFFSQNYSRNKSITGTDINKQSIKQRWFITESGAAGVVMTDDKPRAKVYEKAVNEAWSIERIRKEIPL